MAYNKLYHRKYRLLNLKRIQANSKRHRDKQSSKIKAKELWAKYYQKNKEILSQKARDRKKINPEKIRARTKLNYEVFMGRVKRLPCQKCGSKEKTEGHHEDYSKPLDVIWFCRACHMVHDRVKIYIT